ncbi:MAG: RluA family pseudouridine synthase [Phycisphaerales bacterium]|nr:MAG: RluA family pseudouridine synthase [Phycisphaerales bacterium]
MPEFSVQPNPRIPFTVRHADDDLMVVEKPGMVPTQPGKGHARDTLLNGLFAAHGAALQNVGAARDWGLLHRLDRETSGLVLVALKPHVWDELREEFARRRVSKRYWAIVEGAPAKATGVIRMGIEEVVGRQKTARVSSAGKEAVTAYRVLQSKGAHSLVECKPGTGRLHQIRVHMRAIGCPVLGDTMYGGGAARERTPRLALHAWRLGFHHPATGSAMVVVAPLPDDLIGVCRRLGLRPPEPDAAPERIKPGFRPADSEDIGTK